MKIIKLFVIHILLLSSFQTFAEELRITTADVSTPENTDKTIELTLNKGNTEPSKYKRTFAILGGADANKFTLAGNQLTFIATAFEARSDATYRVNIKATLNLKFWSKIIETTEKTITVTVTKTNLNDGGFHITTAANVDTLEKTNKVIGLTATPIKNTFFQLIGFAIVGGADVNKFTLNGSELTFKATEFKDGSDNTYRVNIKATWKNTWWNDFETDVKTLTVTVHNRILRITTADVSTPENNRAMFIRLTTNQDFNKDVDVIFSITGGDRDKFFFISGNELHSNELHFEHADFEAREDHTYSVEITARRTDTDETTTKTITVTVTDLDDEAPTNIQINDAATDINGFVTLDNDKGVGFVIGTLSATDPDTDTTTNALTFTTDSADFEIVNGNELKTKRNITTIGNIDFTVTASNHVNQSTNKDFTIKVVDAKKIVPFMITTPDVSVPEKTEKVITLKSNKGKGVSFSIVNDTDKDKFTLSGTALTFEATDFKDGGDNNYHVKIRATRGNEVVEKTLTVTIEDPTIEDPTIEDPTTGGSAKSDNAKVTAQAVRKESKSASKLLLSKVGRTLMGRLSYIRHKNKQESSFSANGFVNGIQVSFADSQTNSLINRVLSANGLSNVIPTSSRKVERWDTWTNAKVVIGKSNGSGANKTEFNLKSLNIGMDRRIAQDKIIGFSLGLGKQDRTATGSDFSGDVDTKQYTLSSYGALELSNKGSIEAVLGVAKATHKVSKNNTPSADQGSNGFFASIAYRADLQAQGVDLSPFIRYDISRIKMKANDTLTSSETATDEAIALGIDISKTENYEEGQLTRFMSVEYKSDIRRDGNDYLSKNAEQEVSVKLGLDYQKDDTTTSINYERIQSTNNKAHSYGIEGTVRWKF
ncbi:hypothetical protein BSPWISOXPB_5178 [uncultured Gammaproteobacteria bacterium]|nr:hypothetical protein BSPWISOXPB_5178 [uncultured Gammaproteobacteria bacterium]